MTLTNQNQYRNTTGILIKLYIDRFIYLWVISQVSQSCHMASIFPLIIHSIHYFFQWLKCNYIPKCTDSRFVSRLQTMLNIKTSWKTFKKTVHSSGNVFLNFQNQLYLHVNICIYVCIYIIYVYIHPYIYIYISSSLKANISFNISQTMGGRL